MPVCSMHMYGDVCRSRGRAVELQPTSALSHLLPTSCIVTIGVWQSEDYYQEVLGKMETSLGRHCASHDTDVLPQMLLPFCLRKHRAVNNDLVLLNRQAPGPGC